MGGSFYWEINSIRLVNNVLEEKFEYNCIEHNSNVDEL